MQPIPIPHKQKGPRHKAWQQDIISKADLHRRFDQKQQNIGLLLGTPSHGLTDVDLDCPEALLLADEFLAPTLAFGREGKPNSHRLCKTKSVLRTRQFRDTSGTMLIEYRSTGGQTIAPPSKHPSGELIRFER
ncbi:MAG: bifunctional DNA primase/polymerase, partial [Planctomycetota bacterium]